MNKLRKEALTHWFNATFSLPDNKQIQLSNLNDPEFLETILLEIDDKFFSNLSMLPHDNETNRVYNMGVILHRIETYYQYSIKSPIPEDYVNQKDTSDDNMMHLGELITGIAAQCQRREEYINVMNTFPEYISNEIMQILIELIPIDEDDEHKQNTKEEDEEKINENAMLWIKAESAEKECAKLNEELHELSNKVSELTQANYAYELNLKETEAKYQELVSCVEKRELDHQTNSNQDYMEVVNMSIQLSELKGKLEAKEKSFFQYREEREKLINDLRDNILTLKKENLTLKETTVKFDILKQQMKKFSMEEMYSIKQKLMQNERLLKEKDNEISKLKNYDSDKTILLKRIEELNCSFSIEKEKLSQCLKENEEYRLNIVILEKENEMYKYNNCTINSDGLTFQSFSDTNESNQHNRNQNFFNNNMGKNSNNIDNEHRQQLSSRKSIQGFTFDKIEEEESQKMRLVELETKIKLLQSDKDTLTKIKTTQDELIQQNTITIKEQKELLEKLNKKIEKYTQYKKENRTFISKITDLMDKVDDAKNENLQLKNIKVELENSYKEQLNTANKLIAEEQVRTKELESQLGILKNENIKYEDIAKSNKEYIDQLQQKTSAMPQSDNKLVEMERKLKDLTESENAELKQKCKEKDDIIAKQKEKIIKVDNDMKELSFKIERLPGELSKRDEAIVYYKNLLEQKEKLHNDEMRLVAGLYHSLASQSLTTKDKPSLND